MTTEKTEKTVEDLMATAKSILGYYNVEDIIQIPGTKWIVGGGITCYGAGLCDKVITTNYWHPSMPKPRPVPRSIPLSSRSLRKPNDSPRPSPPDWSAFGPHGFGFHDQHGSTIEVYATSHANVNGGREAVEVLRIDYSGAMPTFTWIGAIRTDPDCWPDAAAVLPDGGVVATSTGNPLQDPNEAMEISLQGGPIGSTRVWYKDSGWADVPGSESISTPNGIIVSPDGQQIYIAASTCSSVVKIDRSVEPPAVSSVDVAGIPDNLRWSADGMWMQVCVHVVVHPLDFEKIQSAAAEIGATR